jgi:hypothetical protein
MCVNYQNKLKTFILKEGWKYDIKSYQFCTITTNFGDYIDDLSYQGGNVHISTNGLHKYTIVDGYVFDNNHPNGVPKLEYFSNLIAASGTYPSGFKESCY